MSDGLKVTVSPDKFSEKETDEKLDLIYQAVTLQQSTCSITVEGFKIACEKYDHFIDKSKITPMINKKDKGIILGAGIGTGTLGGLTIPKFIDFIKELFSGG